MLSACRVRHWLQVQVQVQVAEVAVADKYHLALALEAWCVSPQYFEAPGEVEPSLCHRLLPALSRRACRLSHCQTAARHWRPHKQTTLLPPTTVTTYNLATTHTLPSSTPHHTARLAFAANLFHRLLLHLFFKARLVTSGKQAERSTRLIVSLLLCTPRRVTRGEGDRLHAGTKGLARTTYPPRALAAWYYSQAVTHMSINAAHLVSPLSCVFDSASPPTYLGTGTPRTHAALGQMCNTRAMTFSSVPRSTWTTQPRLRTSFDQIRYPGTQHARLGPPRGTWCSTVFHTAPRKAERVRTGQLVTCEFNTASSRG